MKIIIIYFLLFVVNIFARVVVSSSSFYDSRFSFGNVFSVVCCSVCLFFISGLNLSGVVKFNFVFCVFVLKYLCCLKC